MISGLTKEQAIIVTAISGKLFCKNFSVFHEAVEKKLDRPIWTHEFASKELSEEIREVFWDDFMEMMENSNHDS